MYADWGRKRLILLCYLWHLWEETTPGAEATNTEPQSLLPLLVSCPVPSPLPSYLWHPSPNTTADFFTPLPGLPAFTLILDPPQIASEGASPPLKIPWRVSHCLWNIASVGTQREPFMVWPQPTSPTSFVLPLTKQHPSYIWYFPISSTPLRFPSFGPLLLAVAFLYLCTGSFPIFQGPV